MARFIIADITHPKSIPQELSEIIPHLPSVPVVPIIEGTATIYAMFEHFLNYPWVLNVYRYENKEKLSSLLNAHVIGPAETKVKEIGEHRRRIEKQMQATKE